MNEPEDEWTVFLGTWRVLWGDCDPVSEHGSSSPGGVLPVPAGLASVSRGCWAEGPS